MPAAKAAVERSSAVSSRRNRKRPPWRRAKSQFTRAVRALPIWSRPVGLGATRTRTDISALKRVGDGVTAAPAPGPPPGPHPPPPPPHPAPPPPPPHPHPPPP